VNVTGVTNDAAGSDTVTVPEPTVRPSVHTTELVPSASVVDVAALTVPPPAVTFHATVTSGTGAPVASTTRMTSGLASACAAPPVWASPLTRERADDVSFGMPTTSLHVDATAAIAARSSDVKTTRETRA